MQLLFDGSTPRWRMNEADQLLLDYPDSSVAALADGLERSLASYDDGEEAGRAVIGELRSRVEAGVRFRPVEDEHYYVLDADKKPVRATNEEWKAFIASGGAAVAETLIKEDWTVTTFFEGIDHDNGEEPIPYLFGTTVVAGDDGWQEGPYQSWKDAEEAHWETVRRYKSWGTEPEKADQKLGKTVR